MTLIYFGIYCRVSEASVQQILQQGYESYAASHRLPYAVRKAAQALMSCRTAALGGHVQSCEAGHFDRIWYNSCKHRLCPQCAFIQIERWLIKQKARLLRSDHYHVIFTLPEELHPLWLSQTEIMMKHLFSSVTSTLMELLADAKYLGAKPGIIAALHTWGQTLRLHPHLHCIVTGGGMTASGQWIAVKNGFLLPARVVMKRYRTVIMRSILKSYKTGRLKRPEGMSPQTFLKLLNTLQYKKKWNVRIEERYSHGEGVATYLARYMRGGAIKNSRIVSFDGKSVCFDYKDNRDVDEAGKGKKKHMTLTVDQFVQRLLLHVAVPNKPTVRSYGLYSTSKKGELTSCRKQLGQALPEETQWINWQRYTKDRGNQHPEACPICGGPLVSLLRFYRGQVPPTIPLRRAA